MEDTKIDQDKPLTIKQFILAEKLIRESLIPDYTFYDSSGTKKEFDMVVHHTCKHGKIGELIEVIRSFCHDNDITVRVGLTPEELMRRVIS